MANNYHYIIAGLPELAMSSENKGFQYVQFRTPIVEQLSEKDLRLVELLEEGFNSENLSSEFYAKVLGGSAAPDLRSKIMGEDIGCKNPFIRFYYQMDLRIRERVVEFLSTSASGKGSASAEKYLVEHTALPDASEEFNAQLGGVLAMGNIIERELALDKLKWEEINNFLTFEYFTINNILAALAKAAIVSRWSNLDRETGMELFRKFVDEVRGTFKGIKS